MCIHNNIFKHGKGGLTIWPTDLETTHFSARSRKKGPQKGLAEGWTRATFIVETETLETLKNYAYTERLTMKEVVQMALDQFIDGIDTDSLLHHR